MPEQTLHTMSIAELAPKIRTKAISPVELTDAVLAQVERLQPTLNSFITILHDEARRQAAIDHTQRRVNGVVRLKLYRGNVYVTGRRSDRDSLFDAGVATFEDDAGAFHQGDAEGFIRLNALRLRVGARRGRE